MTHEELTGVIAAITASRSGAPVPFDPRFIASTAQRERIFQPQWDRVNYPSGGTASLTFFANGQGSSVTLIRGGATSTVNKTLRDTSIPTNGVLPTKALDVRGVSVQMVPLQQAIAGANTPKIGDDLYILYDHGYFEFRISDKPRLQLPLIFLRNLDPWFSSTTATSTTIMTPAGVGGSIYPIGEDSMVIPANFNWQFTMTFDGSPAVSQAYDIVVGLHGYVDRPVQ